MPTHTHILSYAHTTHTHSLSYSDSLSLSLTLTHTHTHTTNKQNKNTAFFTALSITMKITDILSESRRVLVQNGWDSSVGRVTDQKASVTVMSVQFPGAATDSPHPPPLTFIADSYGVIQLSYAIACIDTCAHVKVPKLVAISVFAALTAPMQNAKVTLAPLQTFCLDHDRHRAEETGCPHHCQTHTDWQEKNCAGDSKDIV